MNEAKLVVRPAELRPMAKKVVDGTIERSSPLQIFKILRAAGKKVKIEKGGDTSKTGRKIVIEKSVSKQQQKFMGMVRAVQKGEMDAPSPEVAKAAKTMKKKDVKDFAKTKHKGLPNKKEADECWDGYKQVGMKKKGNKMVPDCVPEGKSFFAFREELDEASIKDIKGILTTIGSSKNMDQAVQMVMKKYKVDQGKAKAMVKKAIDSGVTYDKIKKKYAKESVELEEKDVKVPLELLKLYNKGMALPAGSIEHKKVMKQIDDMRKKLGMKEEVELDEATRVSRKDFDKLKKGSMITIDYGSGIRGSTKRTFMVKSKTRSAKYNVDKVNMVDPNKPGGMKFHLYSRDGEDATLALGDMGATINSYSIKESVDLSENYRTLAMHGMGTEKKGEARVGLEMDYYDNTGSKRMGKIVKVTSKGYIVRDDKDGKSRSFAFHDRAKAKDLLAKHGKGKYNEALAKPAKPVTGNEIKRRQNISKTAKKNSPKTTYGSVRNRLGE